MAGPASRQPPRRGGPAGTRPPVSRAWAPFTRALADVLAADERAPEPSTSRRQLPTNTPMPSVD